MEVFRPFNFRPFKLFAGTTLLAGALALLTLSSGCAHAPSGATAASTPADSNAGKTVQPVTAPPATVATAKPTPPVTSKPSKSAATPPAVTTTKAAPTKTGTTTAAPRTSKPAPVKPAPVASTPAAPKPQAPSPKPEVNQPVVKEKAPPSPDSTVALATPAATSVAAPITETIAVSLDHMPLTIRDQWILDRTESQCLLQTKGLTMEDGQGGTRITVVLAPGSFRINTDSDIDLSYSGTGINIDGRNQFALENVEQRTNLSFSRQRSALLASMQSGQNMELTLGFWPTWPVTHTYSLNVPLEHFGTAMKAWETCNKLLSRK